MEGSVVMVKSENGEIDMEESFRSESGKSQSDESNVVVSVGILLEDKETKESELSCTECGKTFNRKAKLLEHQRVHTGEKPFSCSECGRSFNSKSNLVKHMRIHTGEKPFSCHSCGKCFSRKTSLEKHCRIHTGEKPFLCSFCGRCFSQRDHLLRHHKVHSEETPFACTDCNLRFSQENQLMQHRRIHSGEKLFHCSYCWKCFTRKDSLVRHQIDHTGEKPFVCTDCGKRFSRRNYLTKHSKCCSERTHSCSECGKELASGKSCNCQTASQSPPSLCTLCGEQLEELGSVDHNCQKKLKEIRKDSANHNQLETSGMEPFKKISVKEEIDQSNVIHESKDNEHGSNSLTFEVDTECLVDKTETLVKS